MGTREEKGAITLEACVSVLAFLVLMLLLAGLFKMYMAQNATAHTLLQTSQSLSLDVYLAEKIGNGGLGSVGEFINGLFQLGNKDDFARYEACYSEASGNTTVDQSAVKERFVGYLTGGDEAAADAFLKKVNVEDGLDGLDFSGSYVADDTLYIVLKYELKYDMNVWSIDNITVEQTACSKLWKDLE